MTAMTWNAFSHSYTPRSSGSSPHPPQHPLHMRDRGFRQDAVAQIEDEGFCGERLEHLVDRAIERAAAGQQGERIEIALHRPTGLDAVARKAAIDHPIETDRIDRDMLDVAQQRAAGAARKPDDFC